MRNCTLNICNMGFGCLVDIRFDNVPITGPDSSIINVMALDEVSALFGLFRAIQGQIPQGPIPRPFATVYDYEGLESLTPEHIEQATRVYPIGQQRETNE